MIKNSKCQKKQFSVGEQLHFCRLIRSLDKNLQKFTYQSTQTVPSNNTLAANLMAKAWNSLTELQTAATIGAAKLVVRKWAPNLLMF